MSSAFGGLNGLGALAFRYANLGTTSLGVNAMLYLRPVLSLAWLGVFATVTVYRSDFLWIGATAVIAVNALINFRSEDRPGGKWLVLSLLGSGFVVYMRDDWSAYIPGYGSLPAFGDYFGLLTAVATVSALILWFRMERINARTVIAARYASTLRSELAGLTTDAETRDTILGHVRTIDTTTDTAALSDAYEYLRWQIGSATGLQRAETADLQASLDKWVNRGNQGRKLTEPVIIGVFAVVVAGMAVFARPSEVVWVALLTDIFVMLLTSVAAFMTIRVFSRHSVHNNPPSTTDILAPFGNTTQRIEQQPPTPEQALTIGISVAILGVFVYLLILKWLPAVMR